MRARTQHSKTARVGARHQFSLVLTAALIAACQDSPQASGPIARISAAADPAAPSSYQRVDLPHPDVVGAGRAVAVNKHDQVVGVFSSRAFLWDTGSVQEITVPGANIVVPTDINDGGQVVGWWSPSDQRAAHAFIWDNGAAQDIGPVAVYGGNGGLYQGPQYHQVRINDRAQVLGHRPDPQVVSRVGVPFLWQNGVAQPVPLSFAAAISDRGAVVGKVTFDSAGIQLTRAALWDGSAVTLLGTLGGRASWAVAISSTGWVVGGSTTASGDVHPFRWRSGVMEDLGGSGEFDTGREVSWEGDFVDDQGRVAGQLPEWGLFLLWQDGTVQRVPCHDCLTHVLDMNRHGVFTGAGGWVWDNGTARFLDGADFGSNWGITINDRGVVAGFSWSGTPNASATIPSLWVPLQP